MKFKEGDVLNDNRRECRWRIKKILFEQAYFNLWWVEDTAPIMKNRLFHLLTLNYEKLPDQDRAMAVGTLRESLYNAAQLLCANYTFLPEPIDIIKFRNDQDAMEPSQRDQEVALIFHISPGSTPKLFNNDNKQLNILKNRLMIPIIKTLNQLHNHKTVIQAIPLGSVNINPVTKTPFMSGFTTLMKMDRFVGYNPNTLILRPSPVFAAPESFAPDGRLTPATDVYALGKFLLQVILQTEYNRWFTTADPFPADLQNRINALKLPEPWPRFLSLCLQVDPKERFQNATEMEIFLKPQAEQERIKKSRQEQATNRHASQQQNRNKSKPESVKSKNYTQGKTKPAYHQPRRYRENPQLPNAALIIWDELLTDKDQKLMFQDLYRKFFYQYNLTPRLFFQKKQKNTDSDNPFFKLLRDTFGLKIILFEPAQALQKLHHELDPYLKELKNLILVGHSDVYPVQTLLQHPDIANWQIQWLRKGQWNPPKLQYRQHDLTQFIRNKK
ncbi:hypothetical protein [Methylotuvimicrobium sp. KM2]|uniref:hypothetical protein n=1 Tax=Methylotuvimicrobium sp. KM2 TaxID=3133976 RepID=UPI003101A0FE